MDSVHRAIMRAGVFAHGAFFLGDHVALENEIAHHEDSRPTDRLYAFQQRMIHGRGPP